MNKPQKLLAIGSVTAASLGLGGHAANAEPLHRDPVGIETNVGVLPGETPINIIDNDTTTSTEATTSTTEAPIIIVDPLPKDKIDIGTAISVTAPPTSPSSTAPSAFISEAHQGEELPRTGSNNTEGKLAVGIGAVGLGALALRAGTDRKKQRGQ